jgi:Protein of unknown function (DUF2975)
MWTLRPDRAVRVLTAIASVAYFAFWVGAALVLIAVPLAKLFGGPDANFHYALELPVKVPNLDTTVQTGWGPAPLTLDDVRADLRLPVSMLPWSIVALLWTYAAASFALVLVFLNNLRRIFQRVRDGAAFDAQNALRLRTLSVVLLALALLGAVAEVVTAMAVRSGLAAGSSVAVPRGLHVNGTLVLLALVLMALAEVFRHGAELEDEQSLVV